MRIRSIVVSAAVAALLLPGGASAKPDATVTLSAASPEYAWNGTQGQYSYLHVGPVGEYDPANCSKEADSYCEQILLDVRSGGPVTIDASLTEFSSDAADFDLYVYRSDANGNADEAVDSAGWSVLSPSGSGGPAGQDEIFHAEELEPGYYLIVVAHFYNPNATYKGAVKVTGATPVAGATTPVTTPSTPAPAPAPVVGEQPAPAPVAAQTGLAFKVPATLGSARKATRKKALTFRATAGVAITKLTVALLDARKKVVARTTVASFAKGSRTVKLKVRKLKAGRYTLTAEGLVAGAKQVVAQAVKIKK